VSAYTDADVEIARAALLRVPRFAPDSVQVRVVLDAVAPAIAARALRETADLLRPPLSFDYGLDDGQEPSDWLDLCADEIEHS
jgi:hypothetical protein